MELGLQEWQEPLHAAKPPKRLLKRADNIKVPMIPEPKFAAQVATDLERSPPGELAPAPRKPKAKAKSKRNRQKANIAKLNFVKLRD